MANTLGMKVCFLLQVLVAFYKLQNNYEASISFKSNQIEGDVHPSILETLNNLHALSMLSGPLG
jgi:hypothetical protein